MATIYLFCALVGGTVLICQFVLTLIGLGDSGFDLADDIPDASDLELADAPDIDVTDSAHHGHDSTWLFGVLSFRTIVAAATFFGLTGMAARTSGLQTPLDLLLAVIAGVGAMYGVHWLMLSFYRLGQSGTLRIANAVGKTATVYIPIPESRSGQGKVQMKVQDRLEEFPAVTSSDTKLATGARVVVVAVVSGSTLEVRPLPETADAPV